MSYRRFEKQVCLIGLLAVSGLGAFAQTNVKQYARLQRLPLGAITARGWLQQQLVANREGMGGHLDELEPAGVAGGSESSYWVGLVQLAFTLDDPTLKERAHQWVRGTRESVGGATIWSYRGLLAWYDATGAEKVLAAVHKGLLGFIEKWQLDQQANYLEPALIEPMMSVYLRTGDTRLIKWCEEYLRWLDRNDAFHHGQTALLRAELGFNESHAVAFGESLKHPALLYMGNGRHELLNSSLSALRKVMSKCWQITGAPAANFGYLAPPSCRHETAYDNFSTYLNTFAWLGAITGEPRFGDYMEDILFNAAQGARKNSERAIACMSSPNQFQADLHSANFSTNNYAGVYAPNSTAAHGASQAVRIYPEYVRNMFLRDNHGNIFVPLYGPCQANFKMPDGTDFTIEESTGYPFDGTVRFKIKSAAPVACVIFLKVPQWCTRYQVELDGGDLLPPRTGHWLAIHHQWHNSEIKLNLDMEPRVVVANDIYFQQEPLRAVKCGPLLFAQHLKEVWRSVEAPPPTKLPKGWSWYEASCEQPPTFYSLPLTATNQLAIGKSVVASDAPWDNPPIRLEVPMVRSQKHAYLYHPKARFLLPYGNPVMPDKDAPIEQVELVPFGCTTLRIACFTLAEAP